MLDPLDIVADLIEATTTGQPVDYAKLTKLQGLVIAQAGQVAVADAIKRQGEADERIAE